MHPLKAMLSVCIFFVRLWAGGQSYKDGKAHSSSRIFQKHPESDAVKKDLGSKSSKLHELDIYKTFHHCW